jgi:hypothetical protein
MKGWSSEVPYNPGDVLRTIEGVANTGSFQNSIEPI